MNPNQKFKPVVAQLKTGVTAQAIKRPVAPPVYRPQPTPKVLQAKRPSFASRPEQSSRQPVTPTIYRPQATPKAVQPKMPAAAVNRKLPIAIPVSRARHAPRVLQTKSSLPPGPPLRQTPRQPNATRVYPPAATKTAGGQIIQRAEEGKGLADLGRWWAGIAELAKDSKEKEEFFDVAGKIHGLGFKAYTVWHKHDLYIGGGKNKNYVKIVKALSSGPDAGKAVADQYLSWVAGKVSIEDLSHALQELVVIVHVAEVGRYYLDAPVRLYKFMKRVSAAPNNEARLEVWANFKEMNPYAFTAKEEPAWNPPAGFKAPPPGGWQGRLRDPDAGSGDH